MIEELLDDTEDVLSPASSLIAMHAGTDASSPSSGRSGDSVRPDSSVGATGSATYSSNSFTGSSDSHEDMRSVESGDDMRLVDEFIKAECCIDRVASSNSIRDGAKSRHGRRVNFNEDIQEPDAEILDQEMEEMEQTTESSKQKSHRLPEVPSKKICSGPKDWTGCTVSPSDVRNKTAPGPSRSRDCCKPGSRDDFHSSAAMKGPHKRLAPMEDAMKAVCSKSKENTNQKKKKHKKGTVEGDGCSRDAQGKLPGQTMDYEVTESWGCRPGDPRSSSVESLVDQERHQRVDSHDSDWVLQDLEDWDVLETVR